MTFVPRALIIERERPAGKPGGLGGASLTSRGWGREGRVDLYRTVIEVIDARSFSNVWYWLVLAALWSMASHYVLGVPWDLVTRARRKRGAAEDDLHDVLRVHVLRMLAIGDAAGLWLLALASAVLTALALLGFAYGVEFAQAAFLLAAPLSLVWLVSLRTARDLAAGRAQGDALYARLRRHRLTVRLIGMAAIFVTALFGMYQNLAMNAWN